MNISPESSLPLAPVAVIAATRRTGRRVVAGLDARGIPVRALSGTSAVPFRWEDEGTWEAALGASRAAYVSFYPDLALPGASVVRCSWFMQNFSEGLLRDAVLAGAIGLPGPGNAVEPFLDVDDLAAVAVAALVEPGHQGVVHELTRPEPISFAAAAEMPSEVTGRPVVHERVSVDRFADRLAGLGIPREDGVWLGVLGRPATDFATWASRAARDNAWAR